MSMTINERRERRSSLLEMYDRYKINVAAGIEPETDAEHAEMLRWYYKLLDLVDEDEVYFNPPARVQYYAPMSYSRNSVSYSPEVDND